MVKLGLENMFTVNSFANISLHDTPKQNSWEQKVLAIKYPLKVYRSADLKKLEIFVYLMN